MSSTNYHSCYMSCIKEYTANILFVKSEESAPGLVCLLFPKNSPEYNASTNNSSCQFFFYRNINTKQTIFSLLKQFYGRQFTPMRQNGKSEIIFFSATKSFDVSTLQRKIFSVNFFPINCKNNVILAKNEKILNLNIS
jgi:hypothetical protein